MGYSYAASAKACRRFVGLRRDAALETEASTPSRPWSSCCAVMAHPGHPARRVWPAAWCGSSPTWVSPGSLGSGGYEGIQNDSDGNIWIVEDLGGTFKGTTKAKRPNSFIYRFVPSDPGDLHHGKLQVLQVLTAGWPRSGLQEGLQLAVAAVLCTLPRALSKID